VKESLAPLISLELNYFAYSELSVMGNYFVGGCKPWTVGTFGDLYFSNQLMKVKSIKLVTLQGEVHSSPEDAVTESIECNIENASEETVTGLNNIIKLMSGDVDSTITSSTVTCGDHIWNSHICSHNKAALCIGCDDPCSAENALVLNSCGERRHSSKTTIRFFILYKP